MSLGVELRRDRGERYSDQFFEYRGKVFVGAIVEAGTMLLVSGAGMELWMYAYG